METPMISIFAFSVIQTETYFAALRALRNKLTAVKMHVFSTILPISENIYVTY